MRDVDVVVFMEPPATENYTRTQHDALPIWVGSGGGHAAIVPRPATATPSRAPPRPGSGRAGPPTCSSSRAAGRRRSEEHTSELQSRQYLVCRLLLEKKTNYTPHVIFIHISR